MLIKVLSKQVDASEELIALDIEPSNKELYWAETGLRSEDIQTFYKMSPSKTVIKFNDPTIRPVVIKEKFEDFFKRVQDVEYDVPSNQDDETK